MSGDDERDRYRGDVWYEEWRRGLPEGAISDDQISDGYYASEDPSRLVDRECHRRDARRAEREEEAAMEEAYYAQQEYPEEPDNEPEHA